MQEFNMVFLVSTSHFEDRIWFRDDDDFKAAMNIMAILTAVFKVRILAFVLMSNHVHIVMMGDERVCVSFMDRFKQLYSTNFKNRYSVGGLLHQNKVDYRLLTGEECLEKAISYVIMNPVAARICIDASGYKWGSGACYFNGNPEKGKPLGELSIRQARKLLRSHSIPNGDYLVSDDGYILPRSYIPVEHVERIYRTPSRLSYFNRTSSKAKMALETEVLMPSFRDQLLITAIPDICISLFKKNNTSELSPIQTERLVHELRNRFNADFRQIARVLGQEPSLVAQMLDSV